MDSTSLKEYIYKNKKVDKILDSLGCGNISLESHNDVYYASFPDGDNVKGIAIRNTKYLNFYSYSRGIHIEEDKDIFDLVQIVKDITFAESFKYIHKILDIPLVYTKKKQEVLNKFDPLAMFKRAASRRFRCNVAEIRFLDEDCLCDFYPMIHIDLFREGIIKKTIDKFGLCYSYRWNRTIFPHRYWCSGDLVGYNARTMVDNYEEFGIRKYYISKGMRKDLNVYGVWENRKGIEKAGYVVIGEAEKSVCKRDSLCDPTWVAISGHSLSEEQRRIITGLKTHEVVIAMDKDVSIEEVRHMCEKFYNIRKVSYIYDKHDLLGAKDSPADANNQIYKFLFKNRIEYNIHEHKKYLQSISIK